MKYMHVHKYTLDFEDENITEFTNKLVMSLY